MMTGHPMSFKHPKTLIHEYLMRLLREYKKSLKNEEWLNSRNERKSCEESKKNKKKVSSRSNKK